MSLSLCLQLSLFLCLQFSLSLCLQEDRQWALRRGLEEINREIERANRMGVACWFPMGSRDERIVRLAAREASLLNSRCAVSWQCSADVGCRSGSLQCALSARQDRSLQAEQLC